MTETAHAAKLRRWLDRLPPGVGADARLRTSRFTTMRFALGRITQPHLESQASLSLRVHVDGRLATATTAKLDEDGFDRLLRTAVALARVAPREPTFPGFPAGSDPVRPVPFAPIAGSSAPGTAAALARDAIDTARSLRPGARVSGVVNLGDEALHVANSAGLLRSTLRSIAHASVLVEDLASEPTASGWAEGAHWDPSRLNAARLGRRAAERVARGPARYVPAGVYRVVLRSSAAAELWSVLGHLGFNAQGALEGWGCLERKRGRRVAPPWFHLVDDGRSASSLPQSIDHEGVAKRRTMLIDEGVARGPVTDLLTAGRLKVDPSGHGLPPESPWGEYGPSPTQLLATGGDSTEAELVKETRRGILVTRFHYVRVVHPAKAILTGMTRDGTYLIDRGEVVAPIRNLRFTESILTALHGLEAMGRTGERESDERGTSAVTAPPILADRFRFTSATLF